MLHGPAGLVVLSYGIRLTPLGVNGRQLFTCQSSSRNQVLVLLISWISGPFRKGTNLSYMLLLGPLRTTVNFDISVSIGPISISLYTWILSRTLCECARHHVDTLHITLVICCPVLSWLLKGPSFRSQCLQQSPGRSIQRWIGEQLTKWPLGRCSSATWMSSLWQSRYQQRDSMPSYLWQEVTKYSTAGTLSKTR